MARDPTGLRRLVFTQFLSHVAGVHEALAAAREMAQSVDIDSGVTMNLRIFDHNADPSAANRAGPRKCRILCAVVGQTTPWPCPSSMTSSSVHFFARLLRICQIEGDVAERPEIRDGVVTEGVVEAKEI